MDAAVNNTPDESGRHVSPGAGETSGAAADPNRLSEFLAVLSPLAVILLEQLAAQPGASVCNLSCTGCSASRSAPETSGGSAQTPSSSSPPLKAPQARAPRAAGRQAARRPP